MTFSYMFIKFSDHTYHCSALPPTAANPFLPPDSVLTFTWFYFLYHVKRALSYVHLLGQRYCRSLCFHTSSHIEFLTFVPFFYLSSDQ